MPDKSQAQAIYLQYLTERATLIANSQRFLAFDPQGRVLTDVSLTLDDYAEIGTRISQVAADNAAHILPTQEGIAAALGLSITNPTTVSLDINDIQILATKFNKALGDALDVDSPLDKKKLNPEQKLDQRRKILAALAEQPKGSIIALQQEFHFHLGLAVRTYQKAISKFQGHDLEMQAAHLAAAKDVNKLVMAEFAQALKKAMQDNPTAEGRVLNLSVLNAELDAARKRITPKAHESLQKHILKKTGINLTEADLKKLKKVAEETTATANDVLHIDSGQGLATLIKGSENTAHHREEGKDFAHRQLIVHKYNKRAITASDNARLQIRTPSLDLKKEGLELSKALEDIELKLTHIKDAYNLKDRLADEADDEVVFDVDDEADDIRKPKAFIYNLHTALNSVGDGDNKQNEGAEYILKGAHRYNATQLKSADGIMCFVQNISVNGFGDSLGYGGINAVWDRKLTTEATLMTEMALMHTLYDSSAPAEQTKIREIMAKYNAYLNTIDINNPAYFSLSPQGLAVKGMLNEIKSAWKKEKNDDVEDDTVLETAQAALKQLVANNLHLSHTYAKLVQTLSIFVENSSIAGCKSGNERAQAINGRVTVLDTLSNSPEKLRGREKALLATLQALAEGGGKASTKAAALKLELDTTYNEQGLQTAASLVSLLDQGASAKVESKYAYFIDYSTNFAEESAAVMTNLHQAKSGSMQAHKGLVDQMASSWEGHLLAENDEAVDQDEVEEEAVVDGDVPVVADVNAVRLVQQIGDYGVPRTPVDTLLARGTGKEQLYASVREYRETHPGDDPKKHRSAFINYLFSPKIQSKPSLEVAKLKAFLADGNPAGAAIKMEKLLDAKGVELYRLALEEERCSEEFMDATLLASTNHYKGATWTQRLAVPVGGPSASGKSFAARAVVEAAADFMPTAGIIEGNDVVSIDGGMAREISQMRKLMIQHALNKGYTGVTDLHSKSKTLSGVKDDIQNAVMATEGLSMVIPETFAKGGAKKLFESLRALPNTKIIFSRVDSQDSSFAATVQFNGDWRAFRAAKPWAAKPGDFDLNLPWYAVDSTNHYI